MYLALVVTALLMALRLAGELLLSALNRAEVRRHAGSAPQSVAAIMDAPTYAKSVAYTLEKSRFGAITEIFDTLVLALVLVLVLLAALVRAQETLVVSQSVVGSTTLTATTVMRMPMIAMTTMISTRDMPLREARATVWRRVRDTSMEFTVRRR